MSNDQRKPIPLNALDVMSTWMYAPPVQGSQKRPNLRIRVLGNVPRFTVKTNVPNDEEYGKIDFHCDVSTFAVIMSTLADLVEGKAKQDSYTWTYEDYKFINGQRSEKPMVLARLKIGKERDGERFYISVLSWKNERPKIQFFFGPSQYHRMLYGDGTECPQSEISAAYAKGFINGCGKIVMDLLTSEFNPDAKNVARPPGPPGAGGQGGYNNNRGGGSGGNRSAAALPADIAEFDDMF